MNRSSSWAGINKRFGELHVLRDVQLSVVRDEVAIVVGPSGSDRFDAVPDDQPAGADRLG
jgi:ABC-type transporter Mla maintaining outer membrane lipid asymmetry ATPase subunit MlaF